MVGKRIALTVLAAITFSSIAYVAHWKYHYLSAPSLTDDFLEETELVQWPKANGGESDKNRGDIAVGAAHKSTDPQIAQYVNLIQEAQRKALSLLTGAGWSPVSGTTLDEGIVSKKWVDQYYRNVFKLEATVEGITAKVLFDDLIYKFESQPTWNPSIIDSRVLKIIDNSTQIAYSVSASAAGGAVSSRDFVFLRYWELLDGWYVTSSVSLDYPAMPPQANYVRGEQGPSIIRVKDVAPHKMEVQWLLNTDPKGYIPNFVLNGAISSTLTSLLKYIRKHAATLN